MGQGEALLFRPRLRAGDVHRRRLHLPREVLRASRRPGHHHRQRTFPLPRGSLPAFLPRNGGLRHPRDHLQLHHEVTLTSGRTCTPTPSCPEAPPCTPVLLTVCRRRLPPWLPPPSRSRSSLPQRGSTPSGSEAPSWLPSPPSSRCGSPSRSTTSAAPPSSTASASKLPTLLKLIRLQLWIYIQPINFAILLRTLNIQK